jgi:hypothetical protein
MVNNRIDDAIDHDPDRTIVTIAKNLRHLSGSDQDSELFVRNFVELAPKRAKQRLANLIEEEGYAIDSIGEEKLRELAKMSIGEELAEAICCDDYFDEVLPPEL